MYPFCFSPEFMKLIQSMPPIPPVYFPPPPPKFSQDRNDSPTQLRKLFVGGLCHETTNEQLGEFFSQWGKVVDSIVMKDSKTQLSRGFGFITYESIFDAELAMSKRPHWLGGRRIDTKRAVPRDQMESIQIPLFSPEEPIPTGYKLSLTGITSGIHSVDSLRIYFDTFGTLDQVEIRKWGNQGFLIYEDKKSADSCVAHERHMVNDREITVAWEDQGRSSADGESSFGGTNTEEDVLSQGFSDQGSSDQGYTNDHFFAM
uniref:RRM domain-containing protein n=1 Tax=Caenorhabditis tropicalis TaxID=1561998 RepID=A0A1I7UTH9_9PELO